MSSETPGKQDEPLVLESKPLSEREKYFWEIGYREPVDATARIEDTAKFLAGAVTGSSGVLLAALKLVASTPSSNTAIWWIPLGCWWISLLLLLLVLFPQKYSVTQNNPAAIEQAYRRIRNRKYGFLLAGTIAFIIGTLFGMIALVST